MGKPPPKCKAILLCDSVKQDHGTFSLNKIADMFSAPGFPITLVSEHLYLYLVNGIGEYQLRIELVDVASNETLSVSEARKCHFEDRFTPLQVTFPISGDIPRQGPYELIAFADDQEIDRLRIHAAKRPLSP